MAFKKSEYRIIIVNKSIKEVVIYLNENPPPIGREFSRLLNWKLRKAKLRRAGKQKIEEAYPLAHKGSYWKKLLKEKIQLIEQGKVMKFRERKFKKKLKDSLKELVEYLNEHPPNRWQWSYYVKERLGKIVHYRLRESLSEIDSNVLEAHDIANKDSKHKELIQSEIDIANGYINLKGIDVNTMSEFKK